MAVVTASGMPLQAGPNKTSKSSPLSKTLEICIPKEPTINSFKCTSCKPFTKDGKEYFVSYQGEKWHLSAQEYELDEQAQLKFKPKIQNGHFQGYTILQYDEKEQKLVSRGTVGAQDVKYKRVENGLIDCIYEDRQQDGTCKTYFIAKMTQDEYDLLKHFS